MTEPSIFRDIDSKLSAFKAEFKATREVVASLGGAYVRADELGWWKCSYRPTKGERLRVLVRARSSAELIEKLTAAKDRPLRKLKAKAEQETSSAGVAP